MDPHLIDPVYHTHICDGLTKGFIKEGLYTLKVNEVMNGCKPDTEIKTIKSVRLYTFRKIKVSPKSDTVHRPLFSITCIKMYK